MTEDLNALREEIDHIDRQMTILFEKRLSIVDKIGAFKKANDLPITDEAREKQVIKKNCDYLESDDMRSDFEAFFNALMKICRDRQTKEKKVWEI